MLDSRFEYKIGQITSISYHRTERGKWYVWCKYNNQEGIHLHNDGIWRSSCALDEDRSSTQWTGLFDTKEDAIKALLKYFTDTIINIK